MPVNIDAIVFWRVHDVRRATLAITHGDARLGYQAVNGHVLLVGVP